MLRMPLRCQWRPYPSWELQNARRSSCPVEPARLIHVTQIHIGGACVAADQRDLKEERNQPHGTHNRVICEKRVDVAQGRSQDGRCRAHVTGRERLAALRAEDRRALERDILCKQVIQKGLVLQQVRHGVPVKVGLGSAAAVDRAVSGRRIASATMARRPCSCWPSVRGACRAVDEYFK
jgi:hypothetical protein